MIGDDGIMTEDAGSFAGLDRFACREAVVEALREQGLLVSHRTVDAQRRALLPL